MLGNSIVRFSGGRTNGEIQSRQSPGVTVKQFKSMTPWPRSAPRCKCEPLRRRAHQFAGHGVGGKGIGADHHGIQRLGLARAGAEIFHAHGPVDDRQVRPEDGRHVGDRQVDGLVGGPRGAAACET